MPYTVDKFIKVYLTHSELFGTKIPRVSLEETLRGITFLGMFEALSVMSFAGPDDREIIGANFREFAHSYAQDMGVELDVQPLLTERRIYTPQGTLATWKWIFAFCDVAKQNQKIELIRGINLAVLLQAAIADYLYEEENEELIIYEIFQNSVFNTHANIVSMIGRTKIIISDLSKNVQLFDPNEYLDFNSDFEAHYGYTIEDYLAAVSGLLSLYLSTNSFQTTLTDINAVFSRTEFCDLINDIIEPLCFSFEEGKQWAIESLENPWDFRLFREKPFYQQEKSLIIPVSLHYLSDQLFSSLYWKIRRCYSKQDTNFIRFFGRPYEIYIQKLLAEASNNSRTKYTIVPEFTYSNGQNRSPDGMLILGQKLLVIEGKAKGVSELSAIDGDPNAVEKDFAKLVADPYNQVVRRLVEIANDPKSPTALHTIKEVYIIVVNQNDFPHIPPFEERIRANIAEEDRINISYYSHFDIEEFEHLCYLIGRPVKKQIFRILDNHHKFYPDLSFKNFLFGAHLPVKRPEYLNVAAREFIDRSSNRFFQQNRE